MITLMNYQEGRELPGEGLEIPIITTGFLQAFSEKFPVQERRYPFLVEMDAQLRDRQQILYRFIQEEAVRGLRAFFRIDDIKTALGTTMYPVVDMYSVLTEQKQFNEGIYTPDSPPDVGKIVTVTPKAIDAYDRLDAVYRKRVMEDRGEVIGPLGRMLTHTHVHNPILFDRIRQLLGSTHQEYRIAATTSLAMLSAIAIQAKQPPFSA